MVVLFTVGIIAILVGACMCIRSDGSMRLASSRDGSRNIPETRAKIKQSSQESLGAFKYTESFCRNRNVYTPNKWGIGLIVLGVVFVAIYSFLSLHA